MLGHLPGGICRGIEDMHAPIERVAEPQLSPIRRQADAVARATVHFHRPLLEVLCTSTWCRTLPVRRSPISKPSRSLTLTKHRVWLPLIVKGRMTLLKGPTVFSIA